MAAFYCNAQEFRDVTEAHAEGAVAAAVAACTLSDAELQSPEQLAAAHGQLGGHLKKKVCLWHAYICAHDDVSFGTVLQYLSCSPLRYPVAD